jgi:hypothetical protein
LASFLSLLQPLQSLQDDVLTLLVLSDPTDRPNVTGSHPTRIRSFLFMANASVNTTCTFVGYTAAMVASKCRQIPAPRSSFKVHDLFCLPQSANTFILIGNRPNRPPIECGLRCPVASQLTHMQDRSDTWHAIALANDRQSKVLPMEDRRSLQLNWKREVQERNDAIFLLSTLSILWTFTCVPSFPLCLLLRWPLLLIHLLSPISWPKSTCMEKALKRNRSREGLIASSLT